MLPDPPLRRRFIVGSSHGWLATANEKSQLFLVNPITRTQVALPPPLTMKNVRGRYTAEGVLHGYDLLELDLELRDCDTLVEPEDLTLEEGRFFFNMRVAMSADPSSGDCVVMILHMPDGHLSFARVGDTQWTWIDVELSCSHCSDFFYCDGLFYAVRRSSGIHTIDLNGPSPVVKSILRTITSFENRKCIVRAPWGEILQVWRDDIAVKNKKLKVYMMDLAGQKLVEKEDLQGYALFLGFNTSFVLPPEEYPMLTPNCIYLTDDDIFQIYSNRFGARPVLVFNVEDGSFTDLFPNGSSWLSWPLPIWITPSCPQMLMGSNRTSR